MDTDVEVITNSARYVVDEQPEFAAELIGHYASLSEHENLWGVFADGYYPCASAISRNLED